MFVWVSFLFILLVHWLMGKLLARLAMFAAMMVIVSLNTCPTTHSCRPDFFLGGLFFLDRSPGHSVSLPPPAGSKAAYCGAICLSATCCPRNSVVAVRAFSLSGETDDIFRRELHPVRA